MKQLAHYQDGRLKLQEVPVPQAPPGGILVRTVCSVISPGTERMKVEQARMSLLEKARARPDQVRQVLDTARTLGWKAAYEKVRNRLESPAPLGYSAAGVVMEVDALNTRFAVGDRVACGGAECAHHAEFIAVPDLLASPVPEGVADWQAAYTTLASISLQAVRQAGPRLGDRVLVIGQGLVGLLVTRLLQISGARVLAADLDDSRLGVAARLGAERVVNPSVSAVADHVQDWTSGQGVDAVLICAGGKGSALADTAIACLRDRGVIVVVGIHDLELSWREACAKDIQVRYSRSYGPGRYDAGYEWGGNDYPLGYVRWTENRNFAACLHLMQTGALDLAPLTTRRVPFAEAVAVYDDLARWDAGDIGVVLEYGGSSGILPEGSDSGFQPEGDSGRMPESHLTGETPVLLRRFIPYNPDAKTTKTRRNLPHWEQEGVTQFVTFRQADALPGELIREWQAERDRWLIQHPRPWDAETEELYFRLFQERKERWLDEGHGSCLLARPETAEIVRGAMHHFDGERYILDEYVIMPNHVHVLLKPLPGHDLNGIMHSWKSFTSREIKKRFGLGEEPFWQGERFDHTLRSEAALELRREYIRRNPVKAGLKAGFVLGCGVGVVSSPGILPGSSGILPEGSTSGFQSEEDSGRMPESLLTGETPVLHALGAGNFARTMLLPHLQGRIPFGWVVNGTGLSARHVKEKFGFAEAGAEAEAVFREAGAALLIATRHHLHAPYVLRGLAADQHVFVEKPLCLTEEELAEIDAAMAATRGSLMVGFNRRFAPATVAALDALASAPGPRAVTCEVHAGPLAKGHWYHRLEESGGRVLGEACHFFDLFCHLAASSPVSVSAQCIGPGANPDNLSAQVAFANGSAAQLLYTTAGDAAYPKEIWRVTAPGLVAVCENFQRLDLYTGRKQRRLRFTSKGHAEEMRAWSDFLTGRGSHPLPYPAARQSMALTFAAVRAARENQTIHFHSP